MNGPLVVVTMLALDLVLAMAASAAAADPAAAPPAAVVARPPVNLEGWYPPADPESASVRLGRRDAPPVSLPLAGGKRSLDDLGRAVLAAIGENAVDDLLALTVTRREFETILWPEFPESRPATGLLPVDGWRVLGNRLQAGTRGAVSDHGGEAWTFVRIEATAGVKPYRNFRLHRGLVLVARDAAGAERRFDFLRAAVERNGTFKIYSMRD